MIYLITGGSRSGKSRYAAMLAEQLDENPLYIATSRVWDKEHEARIKQHQADRGPNWLTIEEEKYIGSLSFKKKVLLLDCVTLWLTNIFTDLNYELEQSLAFAKQEFKRFTGSDNIYIVVSNEIGMSLHAQTRIGRDFTDLQGWFNQFVADKANRVILMVSGIPITVKEIEK